MSRDYEVIPRTDVPSHRGKWQQLFMELKDDEAVRFKYKTKKEARRKGNSAEAASRVGRCSYRVRLRVVRDGDGWYLYLWKEKRDGANPTE